MAIPELYQTKSFDRDAILKEKYGTDPSRRDIRRFNRYWKSDQKDQDEVAFLQAEHDKQMASWKTATDAAVANMRASGEALTKKWADERAAEEARRAAEAAAKAAAAPKVTVTNADYWNRVAKRYGFDDYNAVAAWQQENGLTVDGKFGSNSYAKWAQLNPDKVGSVPVIKPAVRPRTVPAASTVPAESSVPADNKAVDAQTWYNHMKGLGYTEMKLNDGSTAFAHGSDIYYNNGRAIIGNKRQDYDYNTLSKVFNFGNFVSSNKLSTTVSNGKRYARYDPDGGGDFWVGEDGKIYEADWGGDVGKYLDPSKVYYGPTTGAGEALSNLKWRLKKAGVQGYKQGGTMKKINYFDDGGPVRFGFQSDTLSVGPNRKIISQSFYPLDANGRPTGDWDNESGRVVTEGPDGRGVTYFETPNDWIGSDKGFMPLGVSDNQDAAKKIFMERLRMAGNANPDVQKVQAEMKGKYQQGGAVAPQQDMQQQVVALVQAAMQGDEKAVQTVNQIMEAAKAGDPQATQIAQLMEQVVKQMQGQATAAKYGAKLSYLQSLKCGGKSMKKKEKGGKVCPDCEKQVSKHYNGGTASARTNQEVRRIQSALASRGLYTGSVDGIIGPQTEQAIKKYQTQHGVPADGVWGPKTNQIHKILPTSFTESVRTGLDETANRMAGALAGGMIGAGANVGNRPALTPKHQYGGSFYKNWSKGDIIKLQQFLSREDMLGDAAYKGDYDGKLGPQTIAAIKAYQKKHKITADGMWGYNTNQFHRVVDSSILNKGKYSPNHKTEQGDNVTYDVAGKRMTDQEYYKAIHQLKERFYKDPEAFWNDNGEMSKWRQHLYTTPEGNAIMEEFYSATPDDVKAKIDPKKLSTKIQSARFNKDIRDGMDEAADFIFTRALPVLTLPLSAAAAPLATVTGLAGSAIGGIAGGKTWQNLHAGEERYNDVVTDELGNTAVVVKDPEQERYLQGAVVGSVLGGAASAAGSRHLGKPGTRGMAGYRRTNNSAPAKTWRSQRRMGKGRFGVQGHHGDAQVLDQQVRLNDGTFGYKYQPGTPEYQAYLEGAGGNPSYEVVPIGMKNGGLIPRNK
jgi:peptidoglycan hydrolase-like protein with peptidoglycan-binding domain